MKTYHEKILKRENGDRVKITVELFTSHVGKLSTCYYNYQVYICAPKKKTWEHQYTSNQYAYSHLTDKEKQLLRLKYVTEDELKQAALELWEKLKPS